jgi:hypothetical protein
MFILADRVKQTSITTGISDVVFNSALPSFQSFANAIGDGNSTYYAIETFTKFEIGIGTYTSSTDSLSRDTVIVSSDGTSKINLEGVSTVFVTYPSSKHVILDDAGFAKSFEATYAGIKFPDGTTQNSASTGDGDNGGGDSTRSHIAVNSNTTLATTVDVVLISTLTSDIEVTLPFASAVEGKTISFKFNSNQNKCTILPQSVDNIDSSSSTVIQYKNESISCFSDGSDWFIL